ncbi:MAG: phycobilisome polypeptide [Aphanocapsa feldmannii 277cV]|uniref:Phycobilisome polypeptide n=2 Tax=Aphanocapsa feldmannii TaxID=192050 RepID=A0A524RNF8_9CHRO|nr:MAG: phycobilisome polypeptide [Aphanocapsa feldmannii 277cV]TGH20001.1 MAG: phycobilisome polypeptide [Aphanocapsa feldmannii 277cI]
MTQAPPDDTPRLSVKALQLISKARILGLPGDPRLPRQARELFAEADEQRRQLGNEELLSLVNLPGSQAPLMGLLQSCADDLVAAARSQLLLEQPQLVERGGALYPGFRAEACWRDLWHFLRCVLYAGACGLSDFTAPRGLEAMAELYLELSVPLDAMVRALVLLKQNTLAAAGAQGIDVLDQAFDHLIGALAAFRQRSPEC